MGGMDRPLCARSVYTTIFNCCITCLIVYVALYIGAKIDVDTHLPIPPHLRDVPGIFLEESSTSGVSGTSLRTSDQTPPLSGPRATGLGFFTPDAAGPSTRSRAQQQNNRPMFGPKGTLARKAQSVRLLLHNFSLLTP